MLANAVMDCVSLLSKTVVTFNLKKEIHKLFRSLNMNKLNFLSSTINLAFLPLNYLYLVYAAIHIYWKHSNLEWQHTHVEVHKQKRAGATGVNE